MKALTVVFGSTVAVIVISFVMSIVITVQQRHAEQTAQRSIPAPAFNQ